MITQFLHELQAYVPTKLLVSTINVTIFGLTPLSFGTEFITALRKREVANKQKNI
jgi:hypothetical protein